MTRNMGGLDRAMRGVLGAALVIFPLAREVAVFEPVMMQVGAAFVGAMLLGTAALGACPLYRAIGFTSRGGSG
ncbi:MAG: DUF2892 domain-containing protein [Pseudomonadota bacterium]